MIIHMGKHTMTAGGVRGCVLTACSVSVSSLRLLRHFAAAILFLSLLILFFSSSSGDSWCAEEIIQLLARQKERKKKGKKKNPAMSATSGANPPSEEWQEHVLAAMRLKIEHCCRLTVT